ncbi:hypothetical protein M501DRAFT_992721 [Patellaria atrata CBS 101060]|uniref:Myb-like domain-containing protein n=1 Tax=Patellaria atrata CBS 101060 TaxID=1346257 RepID=A0A9P4S9W2_9PEZI|nr:hypothetical protein M501DRAFT_992721 [Patellaria atrata CBS 101060]
MYYIQERGKVPLPLTESNTPRGRAPSTESNQISLTSLLLGRGIQDAVKKPKGRKYLVVRHRNPGGLKAPSPAADAPAQPAEAPAAEPAPVEEKKSDEPPKEEDKKSDPHSFTEEEDTQLRELKASNTSWKEISKTLDKPIGVLKKRFHELEAKNETQSKDPEPDPKAEAAKAKAEAKKARAEEKKAKESIAKWADEAKAATVMPEAKASSKAGSSKAGSATMAPTVVTLEADEYFSFDELVLITELMRKDYSGLWQRVSSMFYNKTGRRIHPLDIKEKITGSSE